MNKIMSFYTPLNSYTQIRYLANMFFRGEYNLIEDNTDELEIIKNLSTNTYINLIPVSKYRKYTELEELILKLKFYKPAETDISIYGVDFENKEFLLEKKFIDSQEDTCEVLFKINLETLPKSIAYIYFSINTTKPIIWNLKDSGVFTTREPLRHIKLVAITVTYRRESYVIQNIRNYMRFFENLPDFTWIIVDNGKSLKEFLIKNGIDEDVLKKYDISIVENINSGGAGGFTRGVIEVLENPKYSDITHILFMDDDIELEPFAIRRAIDFLKFSKDDMLFLGGGMINSNKPHILHESGAVYNYNPPFLFLNKHNLDLTNKKTLAVLLADMRWTYFGWWFFVFNKKVFKNINLPFPFFFRADDMEFGFRLLKNHYNATDLPAVFVIHEDFFAKNNPFTDYLIYRNELIMRSIHINMSKFSEFIFFIKSVLRALFTYRYERAYFIIKAWEDFLKGPEFFENLDTESYHQGLMKEAKKEKAIYLPSDKYFDIRRYNIPVRGEKLKKWLHIITFGNFLNPLVRKSKELGNDIAVDYIIEFLHSNRLAPLFGKGKVLYYNPEHEVGYFVEIDRKKFIKLFIKALVVGFKFLVGFDKTREKYREKFNYLTSVEFWKKHLKLK